MVTYINKYKQHMVNPINKYKQHMANPLIKYKQHMANGNSIIKYKIFLITV